MNYRKKLIEVALPLAAINAESAREKSIRHGHPSTLHLWWARRPLAACRAVLFSSLVDDPESDPQYRMPDGSLIEEAASAKRADLFNLIEELVMWENSNNENVIRTARAEIARCVASRLIETGVLKKDAPIGVDTTAYHLVVRGHCRPVPGAFDTKVARVRFSFDVSGLPPADVVNAFLVEHAPPVLDPFAGGGSIPLEAQRLGLRAYASDLNPVPVLINKALIEIPPKFAGRPPVNPDSRPERQRSDQPSPDRDQPSPDRDQPSPDRDQPSPDREGVGITEPVAHARGSDARGSEIRGADAKMVTNKLPSAPGSTYHAPNGPGAYFITFTTYGTWLPGDERSFVDREHNRPDEPRLVPDPKLRRAAEQHLKHPPLVFDVAQRKRVLEAILEVCRYRGWWAHAVHVRTNHVHAVVSAAVKPEKVMNDFKAYATRGLRQSGLLSAKVDPVWTEHGSTRYLWKDEQFFGAMTYVRDEQGERVAYGEGTPPGFDQPSPDQPSPDQPSPDQPSPDRKGVGVAEPVAHARGSEFRTPNPGQLSPDQLSPDRQGVGDALEPVADARGSMNAVNSERAKGKKKQRQMDRDWPGATGLADDVRYYGQWMRDEAEKRIGHLYPKVEITAEMATDRPDLLPYVGQQLTVIAWIWARTVACPNPACSANTPIAKTFELSGKRGNEAHVEPIALPESRKVQFRVARGREASRPGNVNRRGADCLICGAAIPLEHIRDEAVAARMGQMMMAIVAEGRRNRVYLNPTTDQLAAAVAAETIDYWSPTTTLPEQALGFRVQRYGMLTHAGLFSRRQLVALSTFADLVRNLVSEERPDELADNDDAAAVATYLAFALSKAANYWSSLCSWYVNLEKMVSTFGLPTLSMVWDFAEANPFSDSSGNWSLGVDQAASAIENLFPTVIPGSVSQVDATQHPMSFKGKPLISTDPPYYDNIGYANLSDFFYVWLRRCLSDSYPMVLSTVLTPKDRELIAEPGRFDNDRELAVDHFERGSTEAFTRFNGGADPSIPMTIFYAFKQQETAESDENHDQSVVSSGWEKMLTSLISSGCSIQGTWPIRTEQSGGLREAKRNALASSIVLVCRPRPDNASVATRKDFITALRRELPQALRNLQRGNIAPVDLAQAAIGPGMAVFTRYAKVLESDGSPMSVRTALGLINQSLDEVLAEQEGEFDGDTRWALAWFEQFGMDDGPFGDAETLSKAKNTAVNGLVEAGLVQARSGKVRLVKRDELPADWSPATDKRLTVWEITQHLIRRLDQHGETGAAELVRQLGSVAEISRDLAYRLYSVCERKKWAQDALAYNSLVIAWPELTKLARQLPSAPKKSQGEMF